jgi:hypothetical protein
MRLGACTSRRKGFVRQVERFWLCDRCSSSVTIAYAKGRGIVTVPLPAISDKSTTAEQPSAVLTEVQIVPRGKASYGRTGELGVRNLRRGKIGRQNLVSGGRVSLGGQAEHPALERLSG